MNYFEFYDIPVDFNIDKKSLRIKFITLSKKYHPDFHISFDPETQMDVLEKSSLNNKAYEVLSDFDKRMKYILELNDALKEGKESISQLFLMEMMDLNEEFMDVQMDSSPKLKKQLHEKRSEFIIIKSIAK